MPDDRSVLISMTSKALSGEGAHIKAIDVLADLDWKLAGERPAGAPHSMFQLVNHIAYWDRWAVNWLDGKKPKAPKHAAGSWPGKVKPASRREWDKAVRQLREASTALERRSRETDLLKKHGKTTRLEMLHTIGSHASYHVGQVAFLRQMLGAWPPPSGGVTW